VTKVALYVSASRLEKARAHKLAPRKAVAPTRVPHTHQETSPWKAHQQFEEQATTVVSDRLLALFLTIRRQWLHQTGEFHKAVPADQLFKLNGRIFISPKTGKPLTQKQWDEVVKTLDQSMARIFKDQPDVLVRKAMLLGKILQGMDYESRMTSSLDQIPTALQLPKDDMWQNAYTFGRQHAAEQMVDLEASARKKISTTILNAIKNKQTTRQLEVALFDEFADLNRDWRMIAETEIATNVNAGILMEETGDRKEGETVYMIGISAPGACSDCMRLINKQVVVLSDEPTPSGTMKIDGEEYDVIWIGKNNIGRKGSNLWACTPLHPHCRCSWTRYYPEMKELLGLGKSVKEPEEKIMIKLADIFTGKGSKRPDSDFNQTELAIGIWIEGEHTNNFDAAKYIAKDHLTEREDYYKTPLFKDERARALKELGKKAKEVTS